MTWYARLLCHHPYAVLSSVGVVVGSLLVLSLVTKPLPQFNDPSLGFESRGTTISNRLVAYQNLIEATKGSGPLIVNPRNDPKFAVTKAPQQKALPKEFHEHKICVEQTSHGAELENCTETDPLRHEKESDGIGNQTETSALDKLRKFDEKMTQEEEGDLSPDDDETDEEGDIDIPHLIDDDYENSVGQDKFFCNYVVPEYGHVVVKSKVSKENLFTLENILAICRLDIKLRSVSEMQNICEVTDKGTCCNSWSLPNYIALLSNHTSCLDITQEDLKRVHRHIWKCAKFFDLQLERGCGLRGCDRILSSCLAHNAVYTILHYLTDANFFHSSVDHHPIRPQSKPKVVKPNTGSITKYAPKHAPEEPYTFDLQTPYKPPPKDHLSEAVIFLPIARSSAAIPYFRQLQSLNLEDNNITVVAMDLGLKDAVFNELLVSDTILVGIGGAIVVILMWCYTGSLFITLITIINVVCAIIIAYFLYTFVYEIEFFPYMNVLTAVIAVGLGADDTFVYCRVWALSKQDKNPGTLTKLVSDTLHHASMSIFVTSLTTAAAFFASFTSHITAIRCFSIFAGTVVFANLILMVTWVPACVVIAERWSSGTCCLCVPPSPIYASHLPPSCAKIFAFPLRICYWFAETGRVFFEKVLPCIVIKPKLIWVGLFGSLAVYAGVVVIYYPGLRLPDSQDFQLFDRRHPFEQYDLIYKYNFWFERNLRRDIVNHLPVRVIWGIKPTDNGNYQNPADKGTLEFDNTFDMSSSKSQVWLLQFCRDLRNQTFYKYTMGPLLPNCFIETFKSWMEKKCYDSKGQNRYPCCEESKFPYARHVFEYCIHDSIKDLYETPRAFFIPGVAGPKFRKEDGKVAAIVIEYNSDHLWSLSYDNMNKFYNEVESWVSCKMKTAPPGLRNGWFISHLEFYDVQRSLLIGTGVAVGVAMSVCLIVLLITTMNFMVSFLAMVSVCAVIITTLATLVLLGWHLNVLESITVSVAIGLAVDLTLHYGVAYRLSTDTDRESRVTWATARLGSPVFMAALTSIAAGAAMLTAQVLAYVHVGMFLVILTVFSYFYATFFYLPLLSLIGPQSGCGQIRRPKFSCSSCSSCCVETCSPQQHIDKTVYQQTFMSESTLSTSSACCQVPSTTPNPDTHELEPLTTRIPSRRGSKHRGASKHSNTSVRSDTSSVSHHNGCLKINGVSGSHKGDNKCSRSRSLSSSGCGKEKRRPLRKVSLPSPGMVDSVQIGEPSPRHSVGPSSSVTTILYSEPDVDPTPTTVLAQQISHEQFIQIEQVQHPEDVRSSHSSVGGMDSAALVV